MERERERERLTWGFMTYKRVVTARRSLRLRECAGRTFAAKRTTHFYVRRVTRAIRLLS